MAAVNLSVDGSIDQGRISVSECFPPLPFCRRSVGELGQLDDGVCVWRQASSQAFEAFVRSEQTAVAAVRRRRFDLRRRSDSRAAGSEMTPGPSAPPATDGRTAL